ncbi:carbohydrate kinase family protein [Micromonospora sp. DT81.3]|uniref:carbohydrate kinase family protein n=1 Tax=Micromonospora sp. DT81.3 TaxID=3416523 RepID=UPI003CE80937
MSILEDLAAAPVLAIIRHQDSAHTAAVLTVLADAGVRFAEVLAQQADYVFGSPEELALVADEPGDLFGHGVSEVIIKNGAHGATLFTPDGEIHRPAVAATVTDAVGAGDAFVGAYLAGVLGGMSPLDRLSQATRVGAIAVSTVGDWEGTPTVDDLSALTSATDNVLR